MSGSCPGLVGTVVNHPFGDDTEYQADDRRTSRSRFRRVSFRATVADSRGSRVAQDEPPRVPAALTVVTTGRPDHPAGRWWHAGRMPEWTYAPAPESRETARLRESYGMFVDGEFSAAGDTTLKTINPATEEVLAEVAVAGEADVDRAVAAARRAYDQVWGPMPGRDRAKYLFRIARIIQERARELAVLETLDNGKPIKESRDVDVPLAAAHFFYHAGWADKLAYAIPGRPDPKPLGVAGQVVPWNFPLLMAAWKLAPALAAGNTVVLKPAETTPLTALVLAEICQQADLPPGVVNVLPGAGATGAALARHPGLDKVAFTGSTDVGREIQRTLAGTGRRLTLELGGKA